MGGDDDFWDDLLGHILDQELVTVVGPDVTVVKVGDAEQTLNSLIGQRLAERYPLPVSPGMTMGEAVAVFLQERGRDEVEPVVSRYQRHHQRSSIRRLAMRSVTSPRSTDLRLFVSTTPDRLLAQAVNEVRFQGRPETREVTASPNRPTSEQPSNEPRACGNRYRRSESVWSSRLHSPVCDPRGGPA